MLKTKKIKSTCKDLFAEIAAKMSGSRQAGLIEPQPPKLPKIILPLSKKIDKFIFKPHTKIDSPTKLKAELCKHRKLYSKYLQNYAPSVKKTRMKLSLNEFDWRLEAESDQKDFRSTLDGKGKWQKVSIPHYGGPLGRAVTYYRTTFNLTSKTIKSDSLFVCFKGVDYKAHIFINGSYIGSHEGFFAPFEFDFTKVAQLGKNIILIKVENDAICMGNSSWVKDGNFYEGDKLYAATGPGYDDPQVGWHHCPPGMGIYQEVFIEARSNIFISDIFVRPLLEQNSAEVWLEVYNCAILFKPISINLSLYGQNFKQTVFQNRSFECKDAGPGINYYRFKIEIKSPRKWDLNSPWLYQIQAEVLDKDSRVLDIQARQFGMRSFVMDQTKEPKGSLYLNDRPIRLRGANTMGFEQQCVMKKDFKQLIDDILLAKICNMNFLRLTQRPVQSEVYEFCDKLGLMTQTDLPLFGVLRRNQFCEAVRQAGQMEKLIRNHPCNIMVSYINEPFPNAWEKPHRHLVRSELEDFFTAADKAVHLHNPDRVIKHVDGDYDPPAASLPDNHCYCGWYNGHGVDLGKLHKGYWQKVKPGWLYGCGEFGSEGLDNLNIIKKYYPKEWLPTDSKEELNWTPNRIVDAQTGKFHYLWFDTQHSIADWVDASQRHQAWITRLMTEAFRRNNSMVAFAIHLFIDAFPSGWMKSIMDFKRQPKPAYFVYLDALTPLMVNLRADRDKYYSGEQVNLEAWICNDLCTTPKDTYLHYQLEDSKGKVICSDRTKAKIEPHLSVFQGVIRFTPPAVQARTAYNVRLGLLNKQGKVLHDSVVKIEVFPNLNKQIDETVVIIGQKDGKASMLAHELGLKRIYALPEKYNGLILLDSFETYSVNRKKLDQLVSEGATVCFIELPQGEYHIAGEKVKVEICGMNPRHFVSRATGHRIVEGFEPDDFKCWYDPKAGYITPILDTTFSADGFEAILSSGNGGWGTDWHPAFAVAQKKIGKGKIIISQIKLASRLSTNPTGVLFARKLLLGD